MEHATETDAAQAVCLGSDFDFESWAAPALSLFNFWA
jgi:hypothetical protein